MRLLPLAGLDSIRTLMELRPASEYDIDDLARLIAGDVNQATTLAGMRLFALQDLDDAIELNRVMITSTAGWSAMIVADVGGPAGLVQIGEAFLAMTPELIEFAGRLYGDRFQEVLGPRIAAMQRVQTEYPPDCLRISEIHVSPDHRGEGIGTALFEHAVEQAHAGGFKQLGLQTLTTNPARSAFEAWGFEVIETRTDPEFEELSGVPGYHLMLRDV